MTAVLKCLLFGTEKTFWGGGGISALYRTVLRQERGEREGMTFSTGTRPES